jgi:hypothetical protein
MEKETLRVLDELEMRAKIIQGELDEIRIKMDLLARLFKD